MIRGVQSFEAKMDP